MALTPFVRFSFGGTNAGTEQWQCGISVAGGAGLTAADLNAWLALMVTPFNTFWAAAGGPQLLNAADTVCTTFRAAAYGASATTATTTAQLVLGTPRTGSASQLNPLQCAAVVSLHTGFAGRTNNGRFYLPVTGFAFAAAAMPNHQLTSAQVSSMATAAAAWLTSVGGLVLGAGTSIPVIAVPGAGAAVPVTQVTVDSVIDTQRRRRNRQIALFTGAHAV